MTKSEKKDNKQNILPMKKERLQEGRQLAYAAAMRRSQVAAQVPIHIMEKDGVAFGDYTNQ